MHQRQEENARLLVDGRAALAAGDGATALFALQEAIETLGVVDNATRTARFLELAAAWELIGDKQSAAAARAMVGIYKASAPTIEVGAAPPTDAPPPSTVLGSLDPELIRAEVRRRKDKIQACYEAQVDVRPGFTGKVTARWVIGGTGRVRQAAIIESPMPDAALIHVCLTDVIRDLTFPEPRGNGIVIVNYPFMFKR